MRTIKDKLGIVVQIVAPVAITLLFVLINEQAFDGVNLVYEGFNLLHTNMATMTLFFFQLFNGLWVIEYLYQDVKEGNKFRLFAAPANPKLFPLAVMLGSWIAAILQGLVVLGGTSLILNPYWGNIFVTVLVLIGFSLFSQVLATLIFVLTKNSSEANGIAYPLYFIIGGFSGVMIYIPNLINHSIVDFLSDWSPLTLAIEAVTYGGRFGLIRFFEVIPSYTGGDMGIVIRNILVMLAITAVVVVVSYSIGKVKKVW